MKKMVFLILFLIGAASCAKMMDTSPSIDVDKSKILKDASSMQVAMDVPKNRLLGS